MRARIASALVARTDQGQPPRPCYSSSGLPENTAPPRACRGARDRPTSTESVQYRYQQQQQHIIRDNVRRDRRSAIPHFLRTAPHRHPLHSCSPANLHRSGSVRKPRQCVNTNWGHGTASGVSVTPRTTCSFWRAFGGLALQASCTPRSISSA